MKKTFLIGLAATAILTGCSKDETVEMASQKAIGFETFVDKATRAVNNDATNTTLKEFAVYGIAYKEPNTIKVLGNEKVTRPTTISDDISSDGGTTAWDYTSTQYWNAGYTYWFSAIAPYGGNWTFDNKATSGYTYGFKNPSTNSGHIERKLTFDNQTAGGKQDLIYSEVDAELADNYIKTPSNVKFTFKHLLSRLKFTFNNKVGDQYILKVGEIKIQAKVSDNNDVAICRSGIYTTNTTFSTNDGEWTSEDADGFDLVFDDQNVYQKITDGAEIYNANERGIPIEDHRYIIPKNLTGEDGSITIVCSFTLYARRIGANENDYSLDYPRPSKESATIQAGAKECTGVRLTISGGFKQGYSYNFIADITAEDIDVDLVPIKFSVESVENWTTTDPIEVPDQTPAAGDAD